MRESHDTLKLFKKGNDDIVVEDTHSAMLCKGRWAMAQGFGAMVERERKIDAWRARVKKKGGVSLVMKRTFLLKQN